MGKFCAKCGMLLDDSAMFCVKCGTPSPALPGEGIPAPVEVSAPAPVEAAAPAVAEVADKPAKKKLSKKAKIIIWVTSALVLLAAAAVTVVLLLLNSGPESAVRNYEKAMNGNEKAIKAMLPEEVWDRMGGQEGADLDEMIAEYAQEIRDSDMEYAIKVTDKIEVDKDSVEQIAEFLQENYDIDEDDVTEVYELEVEESMKGKEPREDVVYSAKIGKKWYLLRITYTEEGEMQIRFMLNP